jgi:hypothetical protein
MGLMPFTIQPKAGMGHGGLLDDLLASLASRLGAKIKMCCSATISSNVAGPTKKSTTSGAQDPSTVGYLGYGIFARRRQSKKMGALVACQSKWLSKTLPRYQKGKMTELLYK